MLKFSGNEDVTSDTPVVVASESGVVGATTSTTVIPVGIWDYLIGHFEPSLAAKAFLLTSSPHTSFQPYLARLNKAMLHAFLYHIHVEAILSQRELTPEQQNFIEMHTETRQPARSKIPAGLTEADLKPPSSDLAPGQSDD